MKSIFARWILAVKRFLFITKWMWNYGCDFAGKHDRIPNATERDEALELAELAWLRPALVKIKGKS